MLEQVLLAWAGWPLLSVYFEVAGRKAVL